MTGQYLENISFLIVEDNLFARDLMRDILEIIGVRHVTFARNGHEAYKSFKAMPADVILLDWQMDTMDGIEFTRLVRGRQDSPNPYVPIIMMTAYSDRSHVFKARDVGVTEYLIKPFSAKALFDRIQAVIERPRRFVRIGKYFGPDRRRKEKSFVGLDKRGVAAKVKAPAPAPAAEMGQDEINALFNPDDVPEGTPAGAKKPEPGKKS
jgi:CheY-like chemotaxis protein